MAGVDWKKHFLCRKINLETCFSSLFSIFFIYIYIDYLKSSFFLFLSQIFTQYYIWEIRFLKIPFLRDMICFIFYSLWLKQFVLLYAVKIELYPNRMMNLKKFFFLSKLFSCIATNFHWFVSNITILIK